MDNLERSLEFCIVLERFNNKESAKTYLFNAYARFLVSPTDH